MRPWMSMQCAVWARYSDSIQVRKHKNAQRALQRPADRGQRQIGTNDKDLGSTSKEGRSMSQREDKHPADVLQDAVCTLMDTPLRILESTNDLGRRFRAVLAEDSTERLELVRI